MLIDFYKVNRFVSFVSPSGDVILQNNFGVVKVTSSEIVKLIMSIDKENKKKINYKYIESFTTNVDSVIKFLLKTGIIERPAFYNFNIETIQFISNEKDVGTLTNSVLEENFDNYSYKYTNDIMSNIQINGKAKSLYIIFLNPYSKKLAKKIRDTFLSEENSYLLTSYIYNNNFYIDSLYSSEWKTPCHICQSSWIESELRDDSSKKMNYQKIVDILYREHEDFEINLPLSKIQTINIASNLSTRVLQYVGAENSIKSDKHLLEEAFAVNLKTFKTHTDTSIHWELCNCYE